MLLTVKVRDWIKTKETPPEKAIRARRGTSYTKGFYIHLLKAIAVSDTRSVGAKHVRIVLKDSVESRSLHISLDLLLRALPASVCYPTLALKGLFDRIEEIASSSDYLC